ncbi:uncharacterized protein CELE_Y57G11C.1144 [Caenorhabditis elegans]|uniref:Uncharacterized protein n=1 Tax=Caenorhabditis elegans TaxID=6239 RepID=I2HAH6_CAEEL|nr:Uncharacterized protein CELE_Y57G11C.1144 [Caenorhabditis elegans]CCH63904.1 Uncharacterized protein CELE_Y57G11C.1144 [Caenorhabditis elegans]|eukprot:NP_001263817.1 Uncharacterized protein CELE_Y57G11C.1144 [Caenorhabditis elegans]
MDFYKKRCLPWMHFKANNLTKTQSSIVDPKILNYVYTFPASASDLNNKNATFKESLSYRLKIINIYSNIINHY